MIRIAICDDSKYSIDDVKNHLNTYSMSCGLKYTVDSFRSGDLLLSSGQSYDLIFMDYKFDDAPEDGITISEKIRDFDQKVTIVFLSGYSDIVFDTFRISAFRFLTKPVDKDRFNEMMNSFISRIDNTHVIPLQANRNNVVIKENKILYIESNGRYSLIYTVDSSDPVCCHEGISSIESRLQSSSFFRCQRSFLVNLRHINGYRYSSVILDNGKVLAVSRKKYRNFLERYLLIINQ